MSSNRDVERIVRSWLKEDGQEVADRVLDLVIDELDTTPQRRTGWSMARRLPLMNSTAFKFGIAAAAVIVIAILAINMIPGENLGQGPSPSSTPSRTSPTPMPDPRVISPGAFVVPDPFPVQVSLTLGDGWKWWTPRAAADAAAIFRVSVDPPAGTGIVFAVPANVIADPCDVLSLSLDPPLGAEVADLADALAGQPNTDVLERTPVTLDGYSGEYLDYSFEGVQGCRQINRWASSQSTRQAIEDERDQVWILDVDGTRLVIDVFSFPGAPEADLAEIRRIVEAAQIEPPA